VLAFDLSEEQLAIQSVAREFAENEIRPIAEKLDRSRQLLQDFPWALVRKGSEIGLRTVALTKEYGGLALDSRTWVILIDELGYPDIACARIFAQNWSLCGAIAGCGTQEQKDRFLPAFRDDDEFLIAGAEIEPEAGADVHMPDHETNNGSVLSATRVGDQYLLKGKKQFVSLGPVAKLLLVSAHTDGSLGPVEGTSTFLVPSDTPGLSIACHDKVGLRIDVQGELIFDSATVPAENLLGGKEGQPYGDAFHAARNIEFSAYAMVLARAALDAAARYASERIQGGRRIIEHQAVALALAEMYIALQAGRSLLWRAAWALDNNRTDPALAMACKVFCTEAAVNICHNALELFGGSGVMRELPMQKYFRDSLVLLHMDGTNHINRIKIGEILGARAGGGRLS
jgi:alkylation response protein AidB-like acyl-CoA dehydrogenase